LPTIWEYPRYGSADNLSGLCGEVSEAVPDKGFGKSREATVVRVDFENETLKERFFT
jgi:hypothetical protein